MFAPWYAAVFAAAVHLKHWQQIRPPHKFGYEKYASFFDNQCHEPLHFWAES